MDIDGAAQDEMVTDGPGFIPSNSNIAASFQRSMSPLNGLVSTGL